MSHLSPSFSNGRPFPALLLLLASASALAGGVAEASAQAPVQPWPGTTVVTAESSDAVLPIETTARGRRAIKGALIGGGVGLGFATLLWGVRQTCSGDDCGTNNPLPTMAVTTTLGALIGAIIGAESHGGKENESRRSPNRLAFRIGPAGRGAKVGVALRF